MAKPQMHDVGHKPSEPCARVERKIWYQDLNFDSTQLPALKDADIRKPITLVINGIIKGMTVRDGKTRFEIEVRRAGVVSMTKSTGKAKTALETQLGG